jgi:RNA polymerase sigma factor (TIGR02999 family)
MARARLQPDPFPAPPGDDAAVAAPAAVCDRDGLDVLFALAYDELRRLAAAVAPAGARETLNPTALVNEAYVKLARSLPRAPASRLHFKRIAARAMRQVLVEAARRRGARKRGGDAVVVTLDEGAAEAAVRPEDVLTLDAALRELAGTEPRQARMIELRFFGGYSLAETAELLGVSEPTVVRDWRAARAWLGVRLRPPEARR